ncbi:hypothetical protein EC988_000168 [Linderina pennispora]|nr:hypothetical protein EC988_000168 [Linderina pennispora]
MSDSPRRPGVIPTRQTSKDSETINVDISDSGNRLSASKFTPRAPHLHNPSADSPLNVPRFPLPAESSIDVAPSVGLHDTRRVSGSDPAVLAAAEAGVKTMTPPAEDDEQWYRDQIDYVRNQVELMENVEVQRDQEARQIRSAWKRELFLLFEDPSSSPSAFVINVFVTFMIILSAVLTTIETIPSLRKGNSQMWFGFETGIVAVFTLEFILRFLGHTDTWQQAWNYGKSAITIIDALAIFPYYVELILHRDTSYEFRFTILRIFRLLRVFSAFKYSSLLQLSIEVMIVAVKRSSDALLAFLLFVALTVTLFSTLMYFAERGTWDEERQAFLTANGEYSTFSSIPAAAYYSIVTLTTTGFGDMVPTTFIGKLISFPMMIAGILLIALPSIIVGRNFTQVWEAARKYRVQPPNVRVQRIGDTLIEDHVSSQGSGRASRRSRRIRHRGRRDGSVSSFGSDGSHNTSVAHVERPGGYTNVPTGTNRLQKDTDDYTVRADPIAELARKDSFEMQEFAATPTQLPEERADGYTQVDTIYAADEDDEEDMQGNVATFARYRDDTSSMRKFKSVKGKQVVRGGKRRSMLEDSDTITVSRAEWDALNAELQALRNAVGGNQMLLKAIAEHLSVPVPAPESDK